MTVPAWLQNEFIASRLEAIKDVARGLHEYLTLSNPEEAGNGLAQFAAVWNASVKDGSLSSSLRYNSEKPELGCLKPGEDENTHSSQRHKILSETYRWLRGRADAQKHHRERLQRFLSHCLEREGLRASTAAQEAPVQTVKRLELALAGIGSAIERKMPDDVVREEEGQVNLAWQEEPLDVQVRWERTAEGGLGLRLVALRSFSVHGQFPASEAREFANCVVEEMAWYHRVGLPNFSYPEELKEMQFPSYLRWRRGKVQPAAEEQPPDWIRFSETVPSPVELSLHEYHAGLAEAIDGLLCEAALADLKRRSDPESREFLVEQLILALAYYAGRSAQEVAELCGQQLQARQPRARGADECAANTAALAFLWSRLNARG